MRRKCEGKPVPEQVYAAVASALDLQPEKLKERYRAILTSCNYKYGAPLSCYCCFCCCRR